MSFPPQYLASRRQNSKSRVQSNQKSQYRSNKNSSRIVQSIVQNQNIGPSQYRKINLNQQDSFRSYQPQQQQQQQYYQNQQQSQQQNQQNQQAQQGQYIQMLVQLDSQNSLSLKVFPHSNPQILAQKFCYDHNIQTKIIKPFAKQIRQVQISNWPQLSQISLSMSGINQSRRNNNISYNNTLKSQNYTLRSQNNSIIDKQNDSRVINKNNSSSRRYQSNKYNNQNQKHRTSTLTTCSTGSSVFDRLYKNGTLKTKKNEQQRLKQKKQKQLNKYRNYPNQQRKSLNQSSSSNLNTSICSSQVRIYQKNMKLAQQSRMRNKNIKQQIQYMKQYQCTGIPQINPLSRLIIQKIRNDQSYNESLSNSKMTHFKNSNLRLYHQNQKSRQKNMSKTIQYLKQKQQKQMKQCTFHPKILKTSKQQVTNTSRYILLHQDHNIRQYKSKTIKNSQQKKNNIMKNPIINEVSKRLMQGSKFQQRMKQYKLNSQIKKQKLANQKKSLQKHVPSINKNSNNNKKRNMSIGQHLYNKSLQKNKQIHTQKNLRKSVVNKKSDLYYQNMKINSFRYIFTQMDSDEDGVISPLKININLQPQILQLLAPLLIQMQQIQIQLDQDQFVQSINRLFNTLNIHQKNLILNVTKNPRRKQKFIQSHTFNPVLNQKSLQIANQIRDYSTNLYQQGLQFNAQKQAKLNQLRTLKAMFQVQQCTFQPNMFYYH